MKLLDKIDLTLFVYLDLIFIIISIIFCMNYLLRYKFDKEHLFLNMT